MQGLSITSHIIAVYVLAVRTKYIQRNRLAGGYKDEV